MQEQGDNYIANLVFGFVPMLLRLTLLLLFNISIENSHRTTKNITNINKKTYIFLISFTHLSQYIFDWIN